MTTALFLTFTHPLAALIDPEACSGRFLCLLSVSLGRPWPPGALVQPIRVVHNFSCRQLFSLVAGHSAQRPTASAHLGERLALTELGADHLRPAAEGSRGFKFARDVPGQKWLRGVCEYLRDPLTQSLPIGPRTMACAMITCPRL